MTNFDDRTYEQKVEDAARAISKRRGERLALVPWERLSEDARELLRSDARVGLEAAGIHPPKPAWPTEQMVNGFKSTLAGPWPGDKEEDTLLRALRCVEENNPIVHAARMLRAAKRTDPFRNRGIEYIDAMKAAVNAVIDALNEAGL